MIKRDPFSHTKTQNQSPPSQVRLWMVLRYNNNKMKQQTLNRNFIGIEKVPEYFKISKTRIEV